MFMEESFFEETETNPAELFSEHKSSVDSNDPKHFDFIKSFNGIYLNSGKDFSQQVKYMVKQALKIEGLLRADESENIKMIEVITSVIMCDPLIKEQASLVIQRFGK